MSAGISAQVVLYGRARMPTNQASWAIGRENGQEMPLYSLIGPDLGQNTADIELMEILVRRIRAENSTPMEGGEGGGRNRGMG